MAPARFVASPDAAARAHRGFWRGLRMAFVPTPGSMTGAGIRELLHGFRPTNNTLAVRGEAHGLAASAVGNGVNFADAIRVMPTAVPFSVFAFVVRRDASNTIQALFGNGVVLFGGWTFQLNYGAGQIGLTRWGIADNASTTLGAVPNTGGQASGVGVTLDGTTARFFLNGRFQSVASGTVNAPGTPNVSLARNAGALQPLVNTSIHVLYVWDRVVSDQEMLALWMDPWAPIRPSPMSVMDVSGALTGALRVSQLAAEVVQQPDPALRVSQLVAEVLVPQFGFLRVSQLLAEVLVGGPSGGTTPLRVSQLVAEVLREPDPAIRVSQLVGEVVRSPDAALRVSQLALEVVFAADPALRVSQLVAEVVVAPAALSVPLTGQLFPRGSVPPF